MLRKLSMFSYPWVSAEIQYRIIFFLSLTDLFFKKRLRGSGISQNLKWLVRLVMYQWHLDSVEHVICPRSASPCMTLHLFLFHVFEVWLAGLKLQMEPRMYYTSFTIVHPVLLLVRVQWVTERCLNSIRRKSSSLCLYLKNSFSQSAVHSWQTVTGGFFVSFLSVRVSSLF